MAAISPTSPTPTPSGPTTRIIGLSGSLAFGDVQVGSSRDTTLTITNSGTGPLSYTSLTVTGGLSTHLTASPTSGTVPAGGNLPVTIRFSPQSPGSFNGTVTVTADQTGGTNTIAVSGVGVAAPVPTATVAGVLRDRSTNVPIVGGSVRVQAGTGVGLTTTTDGAGYYSIGGVAGAIVLAFSAPNYDSFSQSVTVNGDTRFDFSLTRTAAPTAALEYRVTGVRAGLTYANCTGGTAQRSGEPLPWSFTCASVPTGQFLYISAQNDTSSGCVKVQIFRRGVLFRETESCGAFVIATASGLF